MAVKNDPWKLMGWVIPAINKKKTGYFKDQKIHYGQVSINGKQHRQQRVFGKTYLCRQRPTKWCSTHTFLIYWEKVEQTENI